MTELIPGIRESNPELFDTYGRVVRTGKPEKVQTYLPALDRWFSVSAYSAEEEHFIAVFDAVAGRRRAALGMMWDREKLRVD